MDQSDLAVYRQIEDWAETLSGYPTVCGYEEFTYQPDTPLRGNLSDYAYYQRGCIALVCELWDLFAALGLPRRKPFVHHYTHLTRADTERLAAWDQTENGGRILRGWRVIDHPQLGTVEVGGLDPRVGITNPPNERLAAICEAQSALWLKVASLAPRLEVRNTACEPLGDGVFEVSATLVNVGYLPSYILRSAKGLDWNEPLHAEVRPQGCRLADTSTAYQCLGHLEGWGRGRFGDESAVSFPLSRGSGSRRQLRWTVLGTGRLVLRVGSCRLGWLEASIPVSEN